MNKESFVNSMMLSLERYFQIPRRSVEELEEDKGFARMETRRLFDAGWSFVDVKNLLMSIENVNPRMEESVALARIKILNDKYSTRPTCGKSYG